MPQTGTLDIRVRSRLAGTADLSSTLSNLDKTYTTELANGTGARQANNAWWDTRSLGSGANESLDFAGGSLVNSLGAALTFTSIKEIVIIAAPTNTVDLTITRPANGLPLFLASGDGLVLPPGGKFAFSAPSAAGIVVTAGTGDLLNIASGAAISSYDILVKGNT